MENCKFLICGDVKGNFEKLFKRVSSVHKKKGPFDFLLCVGSFFHRKDQQWEHYVKNGFDIPLTVYILGPNDENERDFYPDDLNKLAEINSKIVYLGKRGIFTTCKRLKIGFLSGLEANGKTVHEWNFVENDIKTFFRGSTSNDGPVVDVLLTSVWPQDITRLDCSNTIQPKNSSKLLSKILGDLKPWYHFAAWENVFYERVPYSNKNDNDELSSVTRFIALGGVSSSEKWLHAISLDVPKKFTHSELQLLAGTMTPAPFTTAESINIQSYRYDFSARDSKERKRSKSNHDNKKKTKIDPEKECWFCLSSGQAENHLIIAVGKYTYLSLNRGGLVSQHLNIFPIEHIPSVSQASDAVINDVAIFRSLLKKYFKKLGFLVLFYERYFKTYHFQIHCIPLLPEMGDRVETIFKEKLDDLNDVIYESSEIENVINLPPEQNYFHVLFPSGLNLVAKIDSRFPLNFGRTVLVDKRLMNAEEKEDWRNCVLSVDEETEIVNDLRKSIVYN